MGDAAWARSVRRPPLFLDRFRRPGDRDSTLSIRRAIAAAHAAGGGTVVASPGRVYRVSPRNSFVALNPSGGTARYRVCIQLPGGVTLDMQGSTLQLQGSAEAAIIANANLTGSGKRDSNLGLINAVLDGRRVPSTGTSLLHLAYVDRLTLHGVRIVRGVYHGGWIYNCSKSVFEDLDADDFIGQPWTIGSPLGSGNQVYDSRFGRLRASNILKMNDSFQPGNSFDLVLTRCKIESIDAIKCAAGIKVQWPGADVTIRRVTTISCGDHAGNSGLKLQGDEVGGPVTRVKVGRVVARDQTGPGLFLERCVDCSVDSYSGVSNNKNGNTADIWVGGTNDVIGSLHSECSGGIGVTVRPYAANYRLQAVVVRNPGQLRRSGAQVGVAVFGGSGNFGSVSCIDTRRRPSMSRGVDVNSPAAIGSIGRLTVRGQRGEAFNSVSEAFRAP